MAGLVSDAGGRQAAAASIRVQTTRFPDGIRKRRLDSAFARLFRNHHAFSRGRGIGRQIVGCYPVVFNSGERKCNRVPPPPYSSGTIKQSASDRRTSSGSPQPKKRNWQSNHRTSSGGSLLWRISSEEVKLQSAAAVLSRNHYAVSRRGMFRQTVGRCPAVLSGDPFPGYDKSSAAPSFRNHNDTDWKKHRRADRWPLSGGVWPWRIYRHRRKREDRSSVPSDLIRMIRYRRKRVTV